MNYLYGDSTTSQLKSNFLEFLRDALDFCVFVLQSDARIKDGRAQIQILGQAADEESARLDRFITNVSRAVSQGDKGDSESPTAQCAARLEGLIVDCHRTTLDGIRQNLADSIARIDAAEAAAREGCVKALGSLLAPHDPPDSTHTLRLAMGEGGRYHATLGGKAAPGLEWTLGLTIPDGHPWASPMRVDRIAAHLEIRAPQLSGWLTKEVKTKPQKLERHVVSEIVDDGEIVTFELRTEGSPEIGFDLKVDPVRPSVKAQRVGAADDQSVGPFEVAAEDIPNIVDLATKLRASLSGVERRPNVTATVDGADFKGLPSYVDFIEQFVATIGPIVREIARRSLTPNELILRRALGDDRREELFVTKATLREKLAVLSDDLRTIFDPLGLDGPGSLAPKPGPEVPSDKPPVRSEIPATGSVPPPPMPAMPPSAIPRSAPPPGANAASLPGTAPVTTLKPVRASAPPAAAPSPVRTLQPPGALPPPASPPKLSSDPPQSAGPPRGGWPKTPTEGRVADLIEVVEDNADETPAIELELSSDVLLDLAPESQGLPLLERPDENPRNEVLVATLKKIMALSKSGRADEAYLAYATLFASPSFANYRVDEQRQAIRLMLLAKSHPESASVATAHRAALARLKTIVADGQEPADQELLGVAHLYLGDEKAAGAAFQAALDVERVKNPQSDLIASLMRRVSQI